MNHPSNHVSHEFLIDEDGCPWCGEQCPADPPHYDGGNEGREAWLNGHYRNGATVLIGTGVHCVGCGRSFGTTSIAVDLDDPRPYPTRPPDWPFYEPDCPVCSDVHQRLVDLAHTWPPGKPRPLP